MNKKNKAVKTLNEMLNATTDALKKDVIETILDRTEDYNKMSDLFHDLVCVNGSVNHLISYYDTNRYYDKLEREILSVLMKEDNWQFTERFLEILDGDEEDQMQAKNDFAWAGFEAMAGKVKQELKEKTS